MNISVYQLGFTFKKPFPAGFTCSLSIVRAAYPMVNMFQVITKEARAT